MNEPKKAPKKAITYLPHGLSKTCEEEKAYRRGFDQGVYAGLRLAGLQDKDIQGLEYKQRINEWRHNRLELADPMRSTTREMLDAWTAVKTAIFSAFLHRTTRLEILERDSG
jgi:hypothetical protein